MNTSLPTHIGGYQKLEPEVIVHDDDIFVMDGKPAGFLRDKGWQGMKVGDVERESQYNIYRRIPVAKQGDIDHTGKPAPALPADAQARKRVPLYSGLLAYFPDALCAVAELSRIGNDQHNPGKPLHWDRSKSGDEADSLMRHLLQCDEVDKDGVLHAVKVAWRGLALAQKKLEERK